MVGRRGHGGEQRRKWDAGRQGGGGRGGRLSVRRARRPKGWAWADQAACQRIGVSRTEGGDGRRGHGVVRWWGRHGGERRHEESRARWDLDLRKFPPSPMREGVIGGRVTSCVPPRKRMPLITCYWWFACRGARHY